jgi:hypothetical protein
MNSLKEKIVNISSLIEKQLPNFVSQDNPKFISFLNSYYESQETKYNSLDLVTNLINYYNIGSYTLASLTQYTNLQSHLTDSSDIITVISTKGFPDKNGYLSIDGEIIFYKEKTATQFIDCVRGTSAFVFESVPYNQVVYKQGSVAVSHAGGSQVVNIAYYFTQEFLKRIKSEISPILPEVLAKDLNLITFLKNIKSFYSAKGSEESHKILFRILFNDKKVKIRLTPRGSGAVIDILNYTGKIDTFTLISGGNNYYYELDNGNLVAEPLIEIIGSGIGKKMPGEVVVPVSAQMKVTQMNSSGAITQVSVINEGENYIGPISARIRPRTFIQDQQIYNVDSNGVTTGTAKVDTWDSGTNELILYDVIGYFKIDDKIIGEGGENPRAFISKAYPVTDINKEGNPAIEIISENPTIEYPKNYVFKPSSAVFYEKIAVRCELISNYSPISNLDGINLIELVQSKDSANNIPGTSLVVSEISKISDVLYEFELQKSLKYKNLYLPSSTKVTSTTNNITSSSNSTISVESTFNFPKTNGKLFVNNTIINYQSKNNTQFLNCTLVGNGTVSVVSGSDIHLYGRNCLTSGELTYFIKGYVNGDRNSTPVLLRLHALPSAPIIEDGGRLYSNDVYELEVPSLKFNKTILKSSQYNSGKIDSVIIENAGTNYKVNDKLIISNVGNIGSGFSAQISSIVGKQLTLVNFSEINEQNCIVFTTSENHGLLVGDKVKFNANLGNQTVFSVISTTKFAVENLTNLTTLSLENISYITNSLTALGPINTINISNYGKNYSKLPEVIGINSQFGTGALIQLNSSEVGKLTKFTYDSVGNELIGNKNTKYQLKIPNSAKLINNFELDSIEVLDGGNNYNSSLDKITVNGVIDLNYEFEIIADSGIIRKVNVLKSKYNLTSFPTIGVQSQFGFGATFNSKLKRKQLNQGDILTFGTPTSNVKAEVVKFDSQSSTLEYYVISGTISNGDAIYDPLGVLYGNIQSISNASVYCKRSPYIKYTPKFLDNLGFVSDSSQKIIDSDYTQDWSYTITSNRNTSEWKNQVLDNTHVSGFKVFGKHRIENKREFFETKEEVFNSSVIFKSTLNNLIDLTVNLPKSNLLKIAVFDASSFLVSDIVYGSFSKSFGIITAINENYITINVISDVEFELGEYIFKVPLEFINQNASETNYGISFCNGVYQLPYESYYLTESDYIPRFTVSSSDNIILQRIQSPFQILTTTLFSNQVTLTANSSPVVPSSKEQLIISINGVVQAQTAFTLSGNILTFNSITLSEADNLNVLYHPNLKALTFTGAGANYTINYTPSTTCNLMIFVNGVYQTHLSPLANYSLSGNQLIFSNLINNPFVNLVGWYIDENVTCSIVDIGDINTRKIIDVKPINLQKLTEYLEANSSKSPKSTYEITKNLLDGTVYTENSDTVYGIDTKFMYSSPEYSTSYVEVLNPIIFNGFSKTFNLTYRNGLTYTPINGEINLIVNIDNNVLDHDQYSVTGSSITFVQTYTSSNKCTIIDFNSKYFANNLTSKGANLDRLNVVQNSSRKTFNLSDKGVPQYTNNTGDVFAIKNNSLLRPDLQTHSVSQNKITFQTAPANSDTYNILRFNRQLSPANTKNVLLDTLQFFDGIRTTWPISIDGILFTPISVYHLFVVRNGVYQKPGIDYTISGSNITFSDAPLLTDNIYCYYAYNGINQNFAIDTFKQIDGVRTTFALTTNYVSSQVYSSSNLIITRNGVYQKPDVDYTIGGNSNARYIQFDSPLTTQEPLHIVNYKSNDLVNITNRFTQYNTTTLQYTSQTPAVDINTLLIFVNGTLQVGNSWSFDSGTNRLIFAGFVSLSFDNVTILAFQNQKRTFDTITTVSGVETYSLQINGSPIATEPPINSDLIVSINGVYQLPTTSYSVSGSLITIPGILAGSEVHIYQIGSNETEIIDDFDDNYSKSTYKLLSNYSSVNPVEISDILLLRNGIVQNPEVDYTTGNGFITFTTNITVEDDIYLLYCHGNDKISITNINGTTITLASSIPPEQYKNIIVYLDGTNQFYNDNFTISGNTITLSENIPITNAFVIKTVATTTIDKFDDYTDGYRTKFRTYYNNNNLVVADIVTDADILVSINGRIQHPGVQYTLSSQRGMVYFTQPPNPTDVIFMVRMHGNTVVNLTATGTANRYTLSQSISTAERSNLCIFGTTQWCFEELQNFSYVNTNNVDLNITQNISSTLFGIKFEGLIKLLDQINTPYNGVNTKFNMFLNEQNFTPVGTIENDSIASESSIIITKNGKILDPGVDYTLQGDNNSQIQFTTAPVSTDIISVKSVGSFLKLQTITSGFGGKVYNLKKIDATDYYPNAVIERPRKHENQILVIKNGNIQSPLYDYYIDNNKIVFTNNITGTNKLTILDFRGTYSDVNTTDISYQISPGDTLAIDGEENSRIVTSVLSPTVLKTEPYTGNKASGFSANTTIANGKVTSFNITAGGNNYTDPVILVAKGSGYNAVGSATIDINSGNAVVGPVKIQIEGYDQYVNPTVVATAYSYVEQQNLTSKSSVTFATKLNETMNSSQEFVKIFNSYRFGSSNIQITVNSSTGSGATFIPFVSNGRVTKVQLINGGSNYNEKDIEIKVVGGGGFGCIIEPVLNSSGTITSINLKNKGEGYDSYKVIIDSEIIEYTIINTDEAYPRLFGCTRGSNATSHTQNTLVYFDGFI